MDTPASLPSLDLEKYKLLRERWDKEDSLLVSRTGAFLTTNSILLAALKFQEDNPNFQSGIAIVGLILSVFWLTTSLNSFQIIRNLFLACKDHTPEELKKAYAVKPILFRPNTVFCKVIPGVLIASWLVLIGWFVLKP